MTGADPYASVSPPAVTLRITFAYRGRDLSLVASRRVAMIAPPPVTAPPIAGQSGCWVELRGAGGDLLYHRALSNPMGADVEVFSPDIRQTIARAPRPAPPQGEFEVMIPDLPHARTFHFFGTPAEAPSESAPSRELFRADVDELRKPRGDAPSAERGSPPPGDATR